MFDSLRRSLRDARDIARRARSVGELARALVPPALLKRRVLNESPFEGEGDVTSRAGVLRELCNRLKADAIDESGNVDYARLRRPGALGELERLAGGLHSVGPETLTSDAERIAFWLNLYNVLGIHGVIAMGIEDSVMERPSFFSTVAYRVGGLTFTLDEIENGVLRRNSPHPASKRRLFPTEDPRLAYCPARVDPRVHAALVCCSASCPPVAFYDAEHLERQLTLASQGYVASEVSIDRERHRLRLPITFAYYAADWGDADGVKRFLLEHADAVQRAELERAFQAGYEIDYASYDWSLNGVG